MKTIKYLLLFVLLLSACAPTLGIGSTMISPKDGMVMVYVPAGNFIMGATAEDALAECQKYRSDCQLNSFINEQPPHQVYLDSFWIDRTDITNKMYALCVNVGVCKSPTNTSSYTRSSYYGNSTHDNYPVVYVDWNMAKAYCEWVGRELPTEAQWEKAARGTDGRVYPWGNSIDCSLSNYWGKSNGCVGDTTEVGKYPNGASPYGALDMAGNVWQWVADWYDPNYYNNSPLSNPLGPASGTFRVLRGSSWNNDSNTYARSAGRGWMWPAAPSYNYGFRCAISAGQIAPPPALPKYDNINFE